jgi:hypothetical protein
MMTFLGSMLLARPLLAPMQYGQTYDGIPYLPAAVVIGFVLAILARLDMERPMTPLTVRLPTPP